MVMAAYRRVDDLRSPAGWLPVHRDQLRAQRSVSSIGSLYVFLASVCACRYWTDWSTTTQLTGGRSAFCFTRCWSGSRRSKATTKMNCTGRYSTTRRSIHDTYSRPPSRASRRFRLVSSLV